MQGKPGHLTATHSLSFLWSQQNDTWSDVPTETLLTTQHLYCLLQIPRAAPPATPVKSGNSAPDYIVNPNASRPAPTAASSATSSSSGASASSEPVLSPPQITEPSKAAASPAAGDAAGSSSSQEQQPQQQEGGALAKVGQAAAALLGCAAAGTVLWSEFTLNQTGELLLDSW
jgi:hypothetical protein